MGCCGRAEIGDDSNHGCDSYAGEPEAGNESYGGEALDDNERPPPVFGALVNPSLKRLGFAGKGRDYMPSCAPSQQILRKFIQ